MITIIIMIIEKGYDLWGMMDKDPGTRMMPGWKLHGCMALVLNFVCGKSVSIA